MGVNGEWTLYISVDNDDDALFIWYANVVLNMSIYFTKYNDDGNDVFKIKWRDEISYWTRGKTKRAPHFDESCNDIGFYDSIIVAEGLDIVIDEDPHILRVSHNGIIVDVRRNQGGTRVQFDGKKFRYRDGALI
jgi:hypothetical protein